MVIENGSNAIWDEVRYFVITPDQAMNSVVRQALAGLGIPDKEVFTEQIPAKRGTVSIKIGLDEQSDDFAPVTSMTTSWRVPRTDTRVCPTTISSSCEISPATARASKR
jgi:hypothetical protein